jgi:hypothetical protein
MKNLNHNRRECTSSEWRYHMRNRILSSPISISSLGTHRLCVTKLPCGDIQIEAIGVLTERIVQKHYPSIVADLTSPTEYHKPDWLEARKARK